MSAQDNAEQCEDMTDCGWDQSHKPHDKGNGGKLMGAGDFVGRGMTGRLYKGYGKLVPRVLHFIQHAFYWRVNFGNIVI